MSWSTVQSSTATPTIGQVRSPRRSSRYSDRNVITFARSPVMPKTTNTSAGAPAVLARSLMPLPSFLVGPHGDPAGALVRESGPRPLDDRLRSILALGEQREVHGSPCQRRLLAGHRPSPVELHDGRAASDRRHRPLVLVDEWLRLLPCDRSRDAR